MFVVDTRLGNLRDDPDLARRVKREGAETITVDGAQRRRSRFRTETDSGREIGVVAEDAGGLRAGDVLAGDGGLVTVELAGREALVIDLSGAAGEPETLAAAVELGHRVGNRHRPLTTRGSDVLIAVDADRERVETEVESGAPEGANTRFETVDPTLFDHAHASHEHTHEAYGHSHDHGTHGYSHGVLRRPTGEGGDTPSVRDGTPSGRDDTPSDRGVTEEEGR